MSASGADVAAEVRVLEARVTELEIKASFAEDLVDHLNAQVARQQEQIDALVREIAQLRKQVPEGRGDGAGSLRDELPPHY
ncbi:MULTISPECIES: SlyX family protein [unclassified Roseateles]|jgi:SlyX protein|uniref:SlyX family protein n=1 Tax=unclassified Roseateles TaxID=2626991 RepID=UPI00160761ED|nr:SlyX family protein [Mitsuaria sp. BK037]MBB3280624.1 SlyX protein [Mitsuaria sp. BK037]